MASWGPLPSTTAALLKHARLHPPAPAGIFVPQNLTIAVAHITLVFTPSFLSFGDSPMHRNDPPVLGIYPLECPKG